MHLWDMQIRDEGPGDEIEISALIEAAFLEAEHRDGNEAEIVKALREANSLTISLVAIEDDRIVGHVAFSPVRIDGHNNGWLGLGPVAVRPDRQGAGIGSALIEAGLAHLSKRGLSGCVVLGDPAFYARFGFAADPALRLANVPPEYFQRLSFDNRPCRGMVTYHPAFGAS